MVKGSGANYSYENSLLLSLDNIGGGYRYCAAEKNEGIDSRRPFRFSADKAGKHKLCLPALISD